MSYFAITKESRVAYFSSYFQYIQRCLHFHLTQFQKAGKSTFPDCMKLVTLNAPTQDMDEDVTAGACPGDPESC